LLNEEIPLEEMISDLRGMIDYYLVNTPACPEARARVYNTYETIEGFLMTLNDFYSPEYMEGVGDALKDEELPFD
jgi:hypothetical protein